MEKGATVIELAKSIHKDFAEKFKFARIWGPSAKFKGQRVGKKHVLKEGDIVSIDVGVFKNGFYGDAAITLPVGNVSQEKLKLVETTYRALYNGIAKAVPGAHLQDVSHAIETTARQAGYDVVREYVGHGIGQKLHQDPWIPCLLMGPIDQTPELKEGMGLAIEVIYTMGRPELKRAADGWTIETQDGKISALFEKTVLVTRKGAQIVTPFLWEK